MYFVTKMTESDFRHEGFTIFCDSAPAEDR